MIQRISLTSSLIPIFSYRIFRVQLAQQNSCRQAGEDYRFSAARQSITYQAGLTPPGGFRLQDDGHHAHAGDPVLLYNSPHRYTAFFYCNSVSFMLSIALIILLVNPHLYRPAIRSYALSICSGAGMFALMGAYAAGSTQHLRTSIYVFVLVVVVLFVIAGVVLMLLGILVASVTYQAGLSPPGGTWQSNSGSYSAGNPIMHDNRRPQYLAFFYFNSTSFVASIVVIVLLLPQWRKGKLSLNVMKTAIFLDLLALLGAYAAGSSRGWKTSVYVVALIIAVVAYVVIHIMLALSCCRTGSDVVIPQDDNVGGPQPHEQTNVGI